MLTMLLKVCGIEAKILFDELAGQELIEQLEISKKKKIREAACNFFDMFYRPGFEETDYLF